MQLDGCSLVPRSPTEAVILLLHSQKHTMLALKECSHWRSVPGTPWDEGRRGSWLRPMIAGSCPKCGRRKVSKTKKKPRKRYCPKCGPLTTIVSKHPNSPKAGKKVAIRQCGAFALAVAAGYEALAKELEEEA